MILSNQLYSVQKYAKQLMQFCVVTEVFSKEEIEKIKDLEDLQKFQQGAVNTGMAKAGVDAASRNSDVMWLVPSEDSLFVFEKFASLIPQVNYDHFMLDITGFEPFQYTVYRENGFYNWHMDAFDMYANVERKMSISLVLSEPDTYEGGEFEIIINGRPDQPVVLKPNAGDVIFFDEFNVPQHEFKAFTEWVNAFYVKYEVLGAVNNYYQIAVKITV